MQIGLATARDVAMTSTGAAGAVEQVDVAAWSEEQLLQLETSLLAMRVLSGTT